MFTMTVSIQDHSCRGLTFLTHGQQYSWSVPPGDYTLTGESDVCWTDFGTPKRTRAVQLVSAEHGTWYISPIAAGLLKRRA